MSAYTQADKAQWDEFVRGAKNSHFMFLRDYMDYHAARFPDASLMFHDERGRLVGLLPATVQDGVLSSHAGLSFGGIISGPSMRAELMLDLFSAMCRGMREQGIGEFVYKPIPHIYHRIPAEEDLYALFRCGARLIRRDVSATISRHRLPFSKGRAHAQSQAEKSGLIVESSTDFDAFMVVQEEVLRTRHNARPVHNSAELALLASRFPDNIRLFVVRRGIEILGGVVIYETALVAHTQYICASEEGRRLGALDLIFQHLIHGRYAEIDHFDFGISGEDGGRHLNAGLMKNKESYGARATVFDWYAFDPAAAFERLAGRCST